MQPEAASPELRLMVIGGGGGVSQVLLGARPYFGGLSAAIAVTDTGRSTGTARAIGAMPAPGDLRNTLAALAANPDALLPRLLQHRLQSPNLPALDGMAFGNLMIAALTQLTGDFAGAVATLAGLVGATAQIFPISTADTQLCAELEDGQVMRSELDVRSLNKPPISRLFLADPAAAAYPPALEAIAQADLVALGPGSFFTSVMAALLFDGVADALCATKARVVFICNTTTQPGQTDGLTPAGHVRHLVRLLGPGTLDIALINRSEGLDPGLLARYAANGLHLLNPSDDDIQQIADLGVTPLVRDFAESAAGERQLWNKQDTIRHDPQLLAIALWKLALDHKR